MKFNILSRPILNSFERALNENFLKTIHCCILNKYYDRFNFCITPVSNGMTACKQKRRKLIIMLRKNRKLSVKTSDGWNIPQSTAAKISRPRLLTADTRKSVQRSQGCRIYTSLKIGRAEILKENFGREGCGISLRPNLTAAIWFMTDSFPFRKSSIFPEIYFVIFLTDSFSRLMT